MPPITGPANSSMRFQSPCLALLLACLLPCASFGASPPDENDNDFHFRGNVLDPQGQPVADAEVIVVTVTGRLAGQSDTDDQGNFTMEFSKSSVESSPSAADWRQACVVAKAPGYGPGWIRIGELETIDKPTLQLVQDLPIRGRILDLEGRPIAGAEVEVIAAFGNDTHNLDGFLKTARDQPVRVWRYANSEMRWLPGHALDSAVDASDGAVDGSAGGELDRPVLTTDEEGRFELQGIGRERVVRLSLKGPNIESTLIAAITRPEIEPKWKRGQPDRMTRIELESGSSLPTIYPATFNHFAGPSRPIAGTVRDHETGEPIVGARVFGSIRGRDNTANANTDEQGRYVLNGLATEGILRLHAYPSEKLPHLPARRDDIRITASAPPSAAETDFDLVRGVNASGRLVDEDTGEGVNGWVQYLAFPDNPFVQKLPDGLGDNTVYTADGRFEMTALPGAGLIVSSARDDRYEAARNEDFGRPPNEQGGFSTANRGYIWPEDFHVIKPINPEPGADPINLDLVFRSGKKVSGRLVDSEGRPVTGVRVKGIGAVRHGTALDTNEFTVTGIPEGEERRVIFRHPDRKLGAIVTFTGNEREPIDVTLRPFAIVTGRIVDTEGRPVPGAPLVILSEGAGQWIQQRRGVKRPPGQPPIELGDDDEVGITDADGRFRATELISGVKGELITGPPEALRQQAPMQPSVVATFTLRSGETRDLGDLVLRKPEAADQREDD